LLKKKSDLKNIRDFTYIIQVQGTVHDVCYRY